MLRSFLLLLPALLAVHIAEAQTYNFKSVVIKGGGFVTGIVPHPNAPGLMYTRTDVGGAYRWNATNDSWIPLQDYLGYANEEWSLTGVESIALDPQDTNRLYMTCGWLGVGRPNAVLISTNQGASFTRVNVPFTMEANSDGRGNGERLAVDPNLGSILFNGTRRDGLWKSVNYGANWTKVTSFPLDTTANNVGLVFVEFIKSSGVNGSATPVIFVGLSQGGINIYRSADGGATWTGIATGAAANFMPHRPAQDGLGNMYITFSDGPGPNGVTDGSVRRLNLTTLASTDVSPPRPSGQGGFAGVSVDKQNPNRLVVSTVDRWYPHDEVYRSTNGGTNWTAIYTGATIDASSAPWITYHSATPPVPHWIADIKIDPFNSNRVYHVSGGGIYSSYNLTATTPSWQFRSDGIEEMGLWGGGSSLSSPPSGPLVFTALGDISGFAHYNLDASPAETNHFNPAYGSNTSVDYAELNPSIVVRTHYGAPRGSRSTNAGRTWTDFATHPSAADTNPGVMAISADGGRLVWAPPGYPASYSTNNGATWNQCGGNLAPTYSWEQPLLYSDRVNSNKFYLYMPSTGKMHISTDGGANFSAGPTIGFSGDAIRTVYGYEGHVWMACEDGNSANAGLWRSTNSGASFTKLPGVQNARSFGFGRTATGTGHPVMYMHGQIGGIWGIYRSENQGTNWTRINDNQHQYGFISQITGDPKIYGRCYFGGRGILYGDIPNVPPSAPDNLVASPSNEAVQLSWNTAAGADSYLVKRSTTSGSGYTIITNGLTATSYLDTGLVNGTTYYYVVAATNNFGVSSDSAEASATPGLVANLTVNTVGTLNGNSQPFFEATGNSLNEATLAANIATAFANNAGGVWNFDGTAFNVTSGQTIALNYGTSQANSLILTLTEGAGATGINQASVAAEATSGSFELGLAGSGATRTFTPNKPLLTVAIFNTDRNQPTRIPVLTVTYQNNTTASTSGANADNVYFHCLSGTAANPIVSFAISQNDLIRYDDLAFIVAKPPAPQNLTATPGDANVALAWSAASNATAYYVKRSTTSGAGYINIATNSTLTFTNTGLNNGTLYYFVVSALNASGEGGNSVEVSARPTSFAPPQLSFGSAGNQLQLNWPADHTGWQLQAQTNGLSVGLGTNWSNIAGSTETNLMTLPLNVTDSAVFFRLMRPF